ncbi:MAG TPA: bifunctional folylpolyglutamate synthase/dihydrofolate synthase [Clostridia bacterium]|nr:bifunctional folylpolyglutamate synthase/dihydrofolate synthase [Clostridia bacterium]
MTYAEALAFLRDLTKFGYNLGLERITRLLHLLGNPQAGLKVIHIGGTNGKGSTSAMVTSILKEAGYKVGLFTSPHLHRYTERMTINGEEIPEEKVAALLTEIRPLLEQMVQEGCEHPTEFEVNTALALLYFAREKVDFAVLEVGLGGAIDSTNVVNPLVAVITNVGMDHMDYLGNTIEEITRVKGGIIKPHCQVVTGADRPEVIRILEEIAREKQAHLRRLGRDYRVEVVSSTMDGVTFNLKGPGVAYDHLQVSLLGEHQAINGALAVAAVHSLAAYGYEIPWEAVYRGLKEARWPARLEVVRRNPTVLIDGAHNVDGARTLRRALEQLFAYDKLVLVLGILGDKEREKVLELLAPLAAVLVVTKPNNPRAGNWEEVAALGARLVKQVIVRPDTKEAVDAALALAGPQDLVCITGSLYMVADARGHLLGLS